MSDLSKLNRKHAAPDEAAASKPIQMKLKPELIALILIGLLFLLVSSCGPKDVDRIGEAQACLNEAQSSEVDACLEKIDGIETPGAYSLRCAGYFMREGILDPNVLIQAFSSLDSTETSGEKFGTFMSFVSFTSKAPNWGENQANAVQTYDACFKSEGRATTFIATFSTFAAALFNYGDELSIPIDTSTTEDAAITIATILAAMAIDVSEIPDPGITPEGQSALSSFGSAIVQTHGISCPTSKPIDAATCLQFQQAITSPGPSASPQQIGLAFLLSLAN